MAPADVLRLHKLPRNRRLLGRLPAHVARLHASLKAGAVAIAAVQNLAIEESDIVEQAQRFNACDKRLELRAFHEREDVSEPMKLHASNRTEAAEVRQGFFNVTSPTPLALTTPKRNSWAAMTYYD